MVEQKTSITGGFVHFSDIEAIIEELEKERDIKPEREFFEMEDERLQSFRESLKGGKIKIREK